MDYKGQKLAEYIYSFIVILLGVVAWLVGYMYGDFVLTVYGWATGLAISLVLCIPDWPIFNRNKIIWLEEVGKPNAGKQLKRKSSEVSSSSSSSSKKAKKVVETKSS
jgi:signal peptidase complex subunit 1